MRSLVVLVVIAVLVASAPAMGGSRPAQTLTSYVDALLAYEFGASSDQYVAGNVVSARISPQRDIAGSYTIEADVRRPDGRVVKARVVMFTATETIQGVEQTVGVPRSLHFSDRANERDLRSLGSSLVEFEIACDRAVAFHGNRNNPECRALAREQERDRQRNQAYRDGMPKLTGALVPPEMSLDHLAIGGNVDGYWTVDFEGLHKKHSGDYNFANFKFSHGYDNTQNGRVPYGQLLAFSGESPQSHPDPLRLKLSIRNYGSYGAIVLEVLGWEADHCSARVELSQFAAIAGRTFDLTCHWRHGTDARITWTGRAVPEALKPRPPTPSRYEAATDACQDGDGAACLLAADLGAMGQGGINGRINADIHLRQGCAANHAPACMRLGQVLLDGAPGRQMGERESRPFFQRACDLGERQGCVMVSRMR